MPEKHPIHAKYPELHKSPVVEKAATQHRRHGERIPNEPGPKLEAWLSDLEHIHDPNRPEVMERIKRIYHRDYITGTDDASVERYLRHQAQIAQDQGRGMVEDIMAQITDKERERAREIIESDQKRSLDRWFDYLTDSNVPYPMWFKYYVFRNITGLAALDKQKGVFPKRSKSTTAIFPEVNPEALAYTMDAMAQHYKTGHRGDGQPEEQLNPHLKEALDKNASFADLYKRALELALPKNPESNDTTDGVWLKYDQTDDLDDAKRLSHSLHGHNTGWCVAGEDMALGYLRDGDFYVYYTAGPGGDFVVPRIGIPVINYDDYQSLREVRGIGNDQNMEPELLDIAQAKMQEIDPEGAENYQIALEDMRRLTEIFSNYQEGKEISKEDLRFLYQIDRPIDSFAQFEEDPRIAKLLQGRDLIADMSKVFNTTDHNLLAQQLIEAGRGEFVAYNLDKFTGLDNTTAQQLIEAGQVWVVARDLGNFTGLDNTTAQQLIEAGQGWVVARDLGNFTGVDHNQIAQRLIEARQADAVESVAEDLGNFTGVDHNQIAQRMIEAGQGWYVAKHLNNFTGVDHNQLAQRMIEASKGDAVATYLNNFTDLDNTTAQRMIEAGQGRALAKNLNKFTGIDQNQIAQKMIEAGEAEYVASQFSKFTDLDNTTAQQLIEAGQGQFVRYYPNKFTDLEPETLAEIEKYK